MSDLFDVPEHHSEPAEVAATSRRTRTWIALACLVVLVLIVACVWLFNVGFGSKGPAATGATPAETRQSASAAPSDVTPSGTNTAVPGKTLTQDDLEDLLITYEEMRDADLGLDAPAVSTDWGARLKAADPAGCADLIETVTAKPVGFAGETALATPSGALTQRVYLFDSAAHAQAAVKSIEAKAADCKEFSATEAGGDTEPTTQTFAIMADTGQLSGMTFTRTAESLTLDAKDSGWQRTVAASNVIVEIDYLGADAGDKQRNAVFSLFATAESRLIDAVLGSGTGSLDVGDK